jgi:hypothetical protein
MIRTGRDGYSWGKKFQEKKKQEKRASPPHPGILRWDQHERDDARLAAAVDPVVDRVSLHQRIALRSRTIVPSRSISISPERMIA